MMKISSAGVIGASYLFSVLFAIILSIALLMIGTNPMIIIPLSLLLSLLTYYVIRSYPVSLMNAYRLELSEEADIIFEQFILVFQAGGTIFDAIEMVAKSEHPFLSKTFQDILMRVYEGVPPETCLMEFAKSQPSSDLRRYLLAIISSLERKTDLLEELSGESFEADQTLRQKNMELESRILIISAVSTYLPILITLVVALSGHATDPLVLILIPLLISIDLLITSRFSRQFAAYFDRPRDQGIIRPTQHEIIEEYDEFLNFMMLLGERLQSGDTLEVALFEVRDDIAPPFQSKLDLMLRSIQSERASIQEAFEIASNHVLGQRVANLLMTIISMCEISAKDAGERISKISSRLIKRSSIARERESILAAQRMKVYILTITSSAVLGLLTSLAPFLYIGSLLSSGGSWDPYGMTPISILPLLITLGTTTFLNGYLNSRMVDGKRNNLFAIVCLLLYWISYVFSTSILSSSST